MFLIEALKKPSQEVITPDWTQLRTKLNSLGTTQEHTYYFISHPQLMRQLEEFIDGASGYNNYSFDGFLYTEDKKSQAGHVTLYPTDSCSGREVSFDVPWRNIFKRKRSMLGSRLPSQDNFTILNQAADFMLSGGTAVEILETQDMIREKLYGNIRNSHSQVQYFENRERDKHGKSHLREKGYYYVFNPEQTQQLNLAMQHREVLDGDETLKNVYMRVPVDIYRDCYDGYIDFIATLDFPDIIANLDHDLVIPIFHITADVKDPVKLGGIIDPLAGSRNYSNPIEEGFSQIAISRRLVEFNRYIGGASPIAPQILKVVANDIL